MTTLRAMAFVALALFALSVGCGPKRIDHPPPAPAPRGPVDAIPADLDIAIRVDLEKIRSVLGESAFTSLRDKTRVGGASGDAATEKLLADAIQRADAVWIAFRPGERAELADTVIALKGKFASVDVRRYASTPRWQAPADLGGGWRRYDREKPPTRAAPARIYARLDDVLVFVSSAPLDSVERRLEQGQTDSHVEPAETGVVSLDARARALRTWVGERAPSVGRLFAHAERLKVAADLDSLGLRAEIELVLESESAARETAVTLGLSLKALAEQGGLFERASRGLKVEAVGASVVAHWTMPPQVLASVLACYDGGKCD